MWNAPKPEKLDKIVSAPLYSTEKIAVVDKIVKAHFFIGSCDWYIVEYDKERDLAYGYVNLGDDAMAEWGYISIEELRSIKVRKVFEVDFDKHWTPVPASKIEKIIKR